MRQITIFSLSALLVLVLSNSAPAQTKICKQGAGGGNGCWQSIRGGCQTRCTYNAMRMTPVVIQGCAGQPIPQINVWIDGDGRLDVLDAAHKPNQVLSHTGAVDWDDQSTDPIFTDTLNTKAQFSHTYNTAATYYPSAHYEAIYDDFRVCQYKCSADITVAATIFLATAPECTGGKFSASTNSEKARRKALVMLKHKRGTAAK